MENSLNWIIANPTLVVRYWLLFFLVGTSALYIGFGFAMAALRSKQENKSPPVVWIIDVIISLFFLLLDVLLNVLVYPVICLDLRPKYLITTISHRMSLYNQDVNEAKYRKYIASIFDACLDGKDPSGDHIKGQRSYFKWLGQ